MFTTTCSHIRQTISYGRPPTSWWLKNNHLTIYYLSAYGILFMDKTENACSMGIFEFHPKVDLGDLKFGDQKLVYYLFLLPPNFGLREPKLFGGLRALGDTHSF